MTYIITQDQMEAFEVGANECGHALEGFLHGLAATSIIWSTVGPNGGPPLHAHICEEVHVIPEGRVRYIVDGQRFETDGPWVVRIPAGTEHTFPVAGAEPVTVIGFFPHPSLMDHYREIGPSPLIGGAGGGGAEG